MSCLSFFSLVFLLMLLMVGIVILVWCGLMVRCMCVWLVMKGFWVSWWMVVIGWLSMVLCMLLCISCISLGKVVLLEMLFSSCISDLV